MQTREQVGASARAGLRPGRRVARRSGRIALLGGGTEGNEQLTATVGLILIVLLFVIGVTILRIGQLISIHLFVGLLLIGPVGLKIASTGYRFVRYYTHERLYREKGPPHLVLRLIAPGVVLTTIAVFASGIVLMFDGPAHRDPWLLLHKASFILWLGVTALHVLGHLPGFGHALRATQVDHLGEGMPPGAGAAGRWIVVTGALVAGVVLAIVLIPHFGLWTAPGALGEHHGG